MDRYGSSLDPNEEGLILYYNFNHPLPDEETGALTIIENLASDTRGRYNLTLYP